MSAPYDPRAEALDVLARDRWPNIADPSPEAVDAMEAVLRAAYAIGALRIKSPPDARREAWLAGAYGQPIVPPGAPR